MEELKVNVSVKSLSIGSPIKEKDRPYSALSECKLFHSFADHEQAPNTSNSNTLRGSSIVNHIFQDENLSGDPVQTERLNDYIVKIHFEQNAETT